jgi:hypothetical protein
MHWQTKAASIKVLCQLIRATLPQKTHNQNASVRAHGTKDEGWLHAIGKALI